MSADLFQIGIDGDRAAVIAKHERRLADQHDLSRALEELRGHATFWRKTGDRDIAAVCTGQSKARLG